MNTKKIWLLAIIFGIAMSFLFVILTTDEGNNNQAETTPNEDGVLEDELVEKNHMNTLDIQPGKRAISIGVNDIQSVSGFVRPGDYVDVISVLPVPVGETTTSKVLLSNVRVLAVGRTFEDVEGEPQEPYQMVTLEVKPIEAASIAFASQIGFLTLMLRGEGDTESSPDSISYEQLIKGSMSE